MDCWNQNPNPNYTSTPNYSNIFDGNFDPFSTDIQLSDSLMIDDGFLDKSMPAQNVPSLEQVAIKSGSTNSNSVATSRTSSNMEWKYGGIRKNKKEIGNRIAFRTKSDLEIMDDGFKWRKYGKKAVKNSPHPRNYYKCSNGGCKVKKKVERDRENSRFVITTYEGAHNHESPGVVYYNPINNMPQMGGGDGGRHGLNWNLQPSSPHSSSSRKMESSPSCLNR